jgi:hypothetical protein
VTDINYRSFVGETNRTIGPSDWQNPPDPSQYSDLFKCSHCENFGAEGIDIAGESREDSVDCVRGKNYAFRRCIIRGSTTIKSEIDGWLYEDCEVHAQIEVGQFDNYWTPGAQPTRNGVIRRTYHPGGKVKVLLWNAEVPTVESSDVQITKIPWVIWFHYFCWRYVAIRTWDKPAVT